MLIYFKEGEKKINSFRRDRSLFAIFGLSVDSAKCEYAFPCADWFSI
jgi:hypothetical protein